MQWEVGDAEASRDGFEMWNTLNLEDKYKKAHSKRINFIFEPKNYIIPYKSPIYSTKNSQFSMKDWYAFFSQIHLSINLTAKIWEKWSCFVVPLTNHHASQETAKKRIPWSSTQESGVHKSISIFILVCFVAKFSLENYHMLF